MKNNEESLEKNNSDNEEQAYSKLIKIVNPNTEEKATKININNLRYIIEEIYSLKFLKETQAILKEEEDNEDFPNFVGNYFMNKYNKKEIRDKKIIDFTTSINFYSRNYKDIQTFSSFLNENYDIEDLIFYLFVRNCIEKELKLFFVEKTKEFSNDTNNDTNEILVPVKACKKIGLLIFGSDNKNLLSNFLSLIEKIIKNDPNNNKKTMISAYSILISSVEDYHNSRIKEYDDENDNENIQMDNGNNSEINEINENNKTIEDEDDIEETNKNEINNNKNFNTINNTQNINTITNNNTFNNNKNIKKNPNRKNKSIDNLSEQYSSRNNNNSKSNRNDLTNSHLNKSVDKSFNKQIEKPKKTKLNKSIDNSKDRKTINKEDNKNNVSFKLEKDNGNELEKKSLMKSNSKDKNNTLSKSDSKEKENNIKEKNEKLISQNKIVVPSKELKQIILKAKGDKVKNDLDKKIALKTIINEYTKMKEIDLYFKNLIASNSILEGINEKSKTVKNVKEMALKKVSVITNIISSNEGDTFNSFLKINDPQKIKFKNLIELFNQLLSTTNLKNINENILSNFIQSILTMQEFNLQITKLLLKNME